MQCNMALAVFQDVSNLFEDQFAPLDELTVKRNHTKGCEGDADYIRVDYKMVADKSI